MRKNQIIYFLILLKTLIVKKIFKKLYFKIQKMYQRKKLFLISNLGIKNHQIFYS